MATLGHAFSHVVALNGDPPGRSAAFGAQTTCSQVFSQRVGDMRRPDWIALPPRRSLWFKYTAFVARNVQCKLHRCCIASFVQGTVVPYCAYAAGCDFLEPNREGLVPAPTTTHSLRPNYRCDHELGAFSNVCWREAAGPPGFMPRSRSR